MNRLTSFGAALTLAGLLLFGSCLPAPSTHRGGINITVSGFSIMKESLEKAIFPEFAAKWKHEHGEDVHFTSSFAGSETITNQILQGLGVDVAILAIERDVDRLSQAGVVTANWRLLPHQGIINKTPFIILVRKGNPKGIRDFPDLARPDIHVMHPDPVSSGGAQWSILALYGSELKKSEKLTGAYDYPKALQRLQAIWNRIKSTPPSAREARTQFETGYGDALVTYELEGLLMKEAGAPFDIVVPQSTIFSEHPAVLIDRNVKAHERPVVEAFLNYLWSDDAQRAFVKHHFRSITDESLNENNKEFARIELPFTIEMFGGWSRAYPEIIEGIWRDKIEKKK